MARAWTADLIVLSASLSADRAAFKRKSPKAYKMADEMGLLNQLFGEALTLAEEQAHKDVKSQSLTKEQIYSAAEVCVDRTHFKRKSPKAYKAAVELGLINRLFPESLPLTREQIYRAAEQCVDRTHFKSRSPKAYKVAVEMGVIDRLFAEQVPLAKKQTPRGDKSKYLTKEEIYRVAEKCIDKAHFKSRSPKAYKAAIEMGLLNLLFGNFTPWSDKTIKEADDARKLFNATGRSTYFPPQKWSRAYIKEALLEAKRRATDNNTIYIWKAVGIHYNGNQVYKVGITSMRLGNQRIDLVARKAGMTCEIILCQKVFGKATQLEKKLLCLGENPKFNKFDGSTEFRALDETQLKTALTLIRAERDALSRITYRQPNALSSGAAYFKAP
jgi:hypothetical protein